MSSLSSVTDLNDQFHPEIRATPRCFLPCLSRPLQNITNMSESAGTGPDQLQSTTPADGVRLITLNRPSKRNTITNQLVSEFIKQLSQASRDESVKVIVLTANGPFFSGKPCSGPSNKLQQEATPTDTYLMQRALISITLHHPAPLVPNHNATSRICVIAWPPFASLLSQQSTDRQ